MTIQVPLILRGSHDKTADFATEIHIYSLVQKTFLVECICPVMTTMSGVLFIYLFIFQKPQLFPINILIHA